jgi:hypothetical protein
MATKLDTLIRKAEEHGYDCDINVISRSFYSILNYGSPGSPERIQGKPAEPADRRKEDNSMNLTDRIKNHPIIIVITLTIIGFGAGYKANSEIIKQSGNTIVSVDKVERLKTEIIKLENKSKTDEDKYAELQGDYKTLLSSTSNNVIIYSMLREAALNSGDRRNLEVMCPDRGNQTALGLDLTSTHPVEIQIQKDSIWFLNLKS